MCIQLFVEIVHRVLKPHLALLKKTVEGIPVEAKERSQLILSKTMRAIGLYRYVFKGGARGVLSGRDQLLREIVR
jgi:hypothetical protein